MFMKRFAIAFTALMLLLAILVPAYVFAEGESGDGASTDNLVEPSGFRMVYGYKPLQSYDGATASDYIKGQTPSTAYVQEGGSYTVSANYYTFRDYVFAGWSCNGKIYQPGDVIYNVKSDMTFTATWARGPRPEMVIYGILSYSEGGKVTSTRSVAIGSTVALEDGTWLDQYGRVFSGGTKFLMSSTEVEFSAGTSPSATVNVKYSGAGNGVQSAFKIAKGGSFAVDGCYENRDGYTFTGWQCGDRVYLSGDTCVATEDMVLTAMWREQSKPAPDYCTVNVTVGEGGTATPSGKSTVVKGEKFTFTVQADEYYVLESVVCGGQELGTGGTYTVTVNSSLDVSVSFKALDKPVESQPEKEESSNAVSADASLEASSDSSVDDLDGNEDKPGISRKTIALIISGIICAAVIAAVVFYYLTSNASSATKRKRRK